MDWPKTWRALNKVSCESNDTPNQPGPDHLLLFTHHLAATLQLSHVLILFESALYTTQHKCSVLDSVPPFFDVREYKALCPVDSNDFDLIGWYTRRSQTLALFDIHNAMALYKIGMGLECSRDLMDKFKLIAAWESVSLTKADTKLFLDLEKRQLFDQVIRLTDTKSIVEILRQIKETVPMEEVLLKLLGLDEQRLGCVVSNSKPTMQNRLLGDEELTRLVFVHAYSSSLMDKQHWEGLSDMFESLPAKASEGWDIDSPGDLTWSARDHKSMLHEFDSAQIASLMDIFDTQLQAAEILCTWNCAKTLQDINDLSKADRAKQETLAIKLIRHALRGPQRWSTLQSDLGSLTSPHSPLSLLDMPYLNALLVENLATMAEFSLASDLIHTHHLISHEKSIDIALNSSQEFYDNAPECHLRNRNMYNALEALKMAAQPMHHLIVTQRQRIAATTKLAEHGFADDLTPIQVRTMKPLLLLEHILSAHPHAYRRTDALLDILHGFQYEDASEIWCRTIQQALDQNDLAYAIHAQKHLELNPHTKAWSILLAMSRAHGWPDQVSRKHAYVQCLTCCPQDQLQQVLTEWASIPDPPVVDPSRVLVEPSARTYKVREHAKNLGLQDVTHVASETAQKAARTLERVAAVGLQTFGVNTRFPNIGFNIARSASADSSRSDPKNSPRPGSSASWTRGVGWLLGDEK